MLQDKIIDMALSTADPLISTDRSRCVRMRFNKSTCSICTASCRSGAISIDGGIAADPGKCTECMLCVSECPSGCFIVSDMDFLGLLSKLRKTQNSVPRSVLGCKQACDRSAHEKTSCLGFLSEEYLIALTEYLDKPLYLNLTACGACRNSFIVERLKERIQSVRTKTSLDVGKKILLVGKKADLVFEDVSLDRRSFFQALKTMSFAQVAGLIEKNDAEIPVSYTEKRLPSKRNILNSVARKLTDGKAVTELLYNYAFTVKTGAACNNCFACIGMCPTGALKIKKDAEGPGLLFNSSLCTGCGLCGDFCPVHAVSVTVGFFGSTYFEYDVCNADAFTVSTASGKN
jgi:ferredoxin